MYILEITYGHAFGTTEALTSLGTTQDFTKNTRGAYATMRALYEGTLAWLVGVLRSGELNTIGEVTVPSLRLGYELIRENKKGLPPLGSTMGVNFSLVWLEVDGFHRFRLILCHPFARRTPVYFLQQVTYAPMGVSLVLWGFRPLLEGPPPPYSRGY